VLGIERIGPDAGAQARIVDDLGDVAVLAEVRGHRLRRRDDPGPDRRGGALWDGLPGEGGHALGLVGVDAGDQRRPRLFRHVAAEFGLDAAGVDGRGADAAFLVAAVELHREQDVGRLRAPVGDELGIGRVVEVGVLEIDIGEAVTGGRQVHQARARLHQRGDPVDEHEVTEVVGAELGFEAVRGHALGAGHHPGVGDHDVELAPVGDQGVGAGADAGQRGQVQLHQLEAAAVGRLGDDLLGRPPRLLQVAGRPDHLRAMGGEHPRGLDAEPGRDAGHQNAFSAEVDSLQHFVGGRCGAKGSGHGFLRCSVARDRGPV